MKGNERRMKEKILIIDFDANSRASLKRLLEEEGYNVITANDGLEGRELYNTEKPDLVIIEPFLPKVHGFDLIKEISYGFEKQLSIIIITNFYSKSLCQKEILSHLKNSAFLSKPYKDETIKSVVSGLLKNNMEIQDKEIPKKISVPSETAETRKEEYGFITEKGAKMNKKDDIDKLLNELLEEKEDKDSRKRFKGDVSKEIDEILRNKLAEFSQPEDGNKSSEKKEIAKNQISEAQRKSEGAIIKEEKEDKIKIEEPDQLTEKNDRDKRSYVEQSEEIKSGNDAEILNETEMDERKKERGASLFKETYLKEKERKNIPRWVIFASGITAVGLLVLFLIVVIPGRSEKKLEISPILSSNLSETEGKIILQNEENSPIMEKEKAPENLSNEPPEIKQAETEEIVRPTVTKVTQPSANKEPPALKETPSPVERNKVKAGVVEKKPEVEKPEAEAESLNILPPVEINRVSQTEALKADKKVPPELSSEKTDVSEEKSLKDIVNPKETVTSEKEEALNQEIRPEEITKTGDVVPLSSVDVQPELIKRVEPRYTIAAKQLKVNGKVVVMILISENGDVINTRIIQKIENAYGLNEEAEKAVRKWKYKPAVKNGVKVKVWKPVAIVFSGK